MNKRLITFLALALTLLPIAVFWLYWAHLAVNVPKWDDHALKFYLLESERETTIWGKLYQLFKQHNEHRIVLDRVATWLDFNLFGKLNYRHLMVLGNACLLGVVAIFGVVIHSAHQGSAAGPKSPTDASDRPNPKSLLYLPPIAFLLFNLSSWENAFWGMAALQNFGVVLWVVWAIYSLAFNRSLAGALMLAFLATLTSGNGLIIWPIGTVLLALQRRSKPLLVWLASAVVVVGLYFVGYKKPAGNPPDRGGVVDLLKGWLAFNGASGEVFALGNPFTACLVLGAILTIALLTAGVWLLRNQIQLLRRTDPMSNQIQLFLLGCLAFGLGTAAIVAWSRVGFGMETLITSRYKIYSLLLLCVAYVFAVTHTSGRVRQLVGVLGLTGSAGLASLSYLTYSDEVIWWRRWMLTNQYNWTFQTDRPVSTIDPTTARWIDNAPAYYDPCLPAIYQPSPLSEPAELDSVYEANGQFFVRLKAAIRPSVRYPDNGMTVLLQSDKRTYIYGTLPDPAPNALVALRRGLYPTEQQVASFPANEPEPGTYRLSLLIYSSDGRSCLIRSTKHTLVVKPRPKNELEKNW
ncbi:MAG: hypothetical protein EAZ91_15680 [Cytophagales bacterium]|nr:MAG: hypothetical protein EAZ91_15680 [Cytophagales bacterium]